MRGPEASFTPGAEVAELVPSAQEALGHEYKDATATAVHARVLGVRFVGCGVVSRLPENLEVLRDDRFRRVLSAAAISWFGDRMVVLALAFAVLAIGGSAAQIGVVLAVRSGSLVVSLLLGGVVADRLSRRAIMVCADLSRVLTQGLLAGLVIVGDTEIWSLALLTGLTGVAGGFFNPASTGLLPAIVPAEHLQHANGMRATAMSAGMIGGPVLAGALVATVGAGWALSLDAGDVCGQRRTSDGSASARQR